MYIYHWWGPTTCRMHVSLTEPKTHIIYTTALYNYTLRVRLHVLTLMFEYRYLDNFIPGQKSRKPCNQKNKLKISQKPTWRPLNAPTKYTPSLSTNRQQVSMLQTTFNSWIIKKIHENWSSTNIDETTVWLHSNLFTTYLEKFPKHDYFNNQKGSKMNVVHSCMQIPSICYWKLSNRQ